MHKAVWSLCVLEAVAAFHTPTSVGIPSGLRLRSHAAKPAIVMQSAPVDRRSMLATAGGFAMTVFGAAPAFAAPSEAVLKRAETVKAAVKKICIAGSTGSIPLDDLVVAIIDDGSPEVQPAFLGVASSGAKAIKIKYDPKGGNKGRLKTQAEYLEKECTAVVAPTSDSIFDLMQGTGLECSGCSYGGGGAPPKWFIIMNDRGKSNKELSGEAGMTGWGCFNDKLALVPGNVFKQKPGMEGIAKCGPYGIQVAVLGLDSVAKLDIQPNKALMAVQGVSFDLDELFEYAGYNKK